MLGVTRRFTENKAGQPKIRRVEETFSEPLGMLSLGEVKTEGVGSKGVPSNLPSGSGSDRGKSTESVDETSEDEEELPLDAVFEILKNERRRRTLWYLKEHDQPVTLSDLAEHIAALENDTTVARLNSKERKRAYVGLYQCHLPKMDELGAIEFNRSRGLIEMGNCSEQLFKYLETDEPGRNWAGYYLGLAGISGSLLALGILFTGITSTAVTVASGASILSFALLAAIHAIQEIPDEEDDDSSSGFERFGAQLASHLKT